MELEGSTVSSPADLLPGPIAIIGAAGFIGSHLTATLAGVRSDVLGLALNTSNAWRLEALGIADAVTMLETSDLMSALADSRPRTVFNLSAHGAYENQRDSSRILATNLDLVVQLADWCSRNSSRLVQAGSSSEYGINCSAPREAEARPMPNSLYGVTKLGASLWLEHLARISDLQSVTLRLYSVYGPLEDPMRLVPTIVREGLSRRLPPLADARISRDFVYIDDVVESFISAAHHADEQARGSTINICTGVETTMAEVADVASRIFRLDVAPEFGTFARHWDLASWVGDPTLAQEIIGWRATTSFADGMALTAQYYAHGNRQESLFEREVGHKSGAVVRESVSVVVACYKDAEAIPVMYARVRETLETAGYDFELIFVNDSSPDHSLQVIEDLSVQDARVIGITHSRNFGSQAAFLSGMKMARGDYVALLDGDLQDPPELLAPMLTQVRAGYDVVFGRRVSREANLPMRLAYKAFYRVFSRLSSFSIPQDAGDFSVMTKSVAKTISAMPERDLFIRAQRAYVGFRQTGVDYVRPERMFGQSTNSLRKNFGWAIKGFLAVSRTPLTALSLFGIGVFILAAFLIVLQILTRLFFPDLAPRGLTTVSILIVGMGAVNILGLSIIGEYVGRILEESKRRPRFIRRLVTQSGETRAEEPINEGDDL